MYELPRTIPDVKMRARAGGSGINDPLSLEEVISKSFKANGATVHCPLTVQ